MAYVRLTEDEWDIQANWGFGWELETTETTFKAARECIKDYHNNAPGAYRIVKRRVKLTT